MTDSSINMKTRAIPKVVCCLCGYHTTLRLSADVMLKNEFFKADILLFVTL